jgi:uncharacterized protein YunC (DUF1805 family)
VGVVVEARVVVEQGEEDVDVTDQLGEAVQRVVGDADLDSLLNEPLPSLLAAREKRECGEGSDGDVTPKCACTRECVMVADDVRRG